MEAGRPLRPWDNRPRLGPRLTWVWQAFQDLQTCRDAGMGVGAIPWTAINEYARSKDIHDQERFEYLIREMDEAWLDIHYGNEDEENGG